MRIQILPLPSIVVGDNVEEPFALIVDQWPEGISTKDDETWLRFADTCGARAILATPQAVEVVDRYAGPAEPAEPKIMVESFAIREETDLARVSAAVIAQLRKAGKVG